MRKKFEIIIDYIEKLIELNELKQGQRLPAIRIMAEKYKCNKSTVIRAYKELEENHKIYSVPKSGYYLVEKGSQTDSELSPINFSEVIPDPKLLPYKEFNHCINRAVELYKKELFSYGDAQGFESLRKSLVSHFSEYQIFTSAENICITSGAQQALSILAKMDFPNKKRNVLIEQPTYSLIHQLVKMNGDKLVGIKRDYNGIDLGELEEVFKNGNIKFFYTIPRLHNPLGTSYTEKIKKRIVELAEKYDVYIVEDDYLGDIDTNKKSMPLCFYDIYGRVIYIKSFSKAFMPGIRLGTVVLHKELKKEFLSYKRYFDLNTSVLAQGALEIFINSGMYRKHNKKVKVSYREKMHTLNECIKTIDTNAVDMYIPDTGFFIWLKFNKYIDMNKLTKRLEKRNVCIDSESNFFIESNTDSRCLRICISKLSKDRIKIGMRILFEEINKLV